ncbi:MAG: sensor histidine kinase [Segetibacter sp.]|nr:sensor histidine kinase [Segetibacter sp.]
MRFLRLPEFKVSFGFLLLATCWILLSDRVLLQVQSHVTSVELTQIQSFKGVMFVVTLSLLLFVLIRKAQKELRRSQEEYKGVFDLNAEPMLIYLNADKTIMRVNSATEDRFGYTWQELRKMTIADLIEEDTDKEGATVKNGQKSIVIYKKKNNETLICEETKARLLVNNKDATLVTLHDITILTKVKSEIAERETQLNLILNSITDGFFIIDEDFKVLRANDIFKKYLEKPEASIENQTLFELFPEFNGGRAHHEFLYALDHKEAVHFELIAPSAHSWLRVSAYPFDKGLSVIFRDVTKEKEGELNTLRHEQNMLALINNTEDLIWSIDKDFKYFAFNHEYETHFKYYFKEDLHIGKGALNEAQGPEHVKEWRTLYERALSGETFSIEKEFQDPVLKRQFTSIRFSPVYTAGGEVMGVGCFLQNVTKRKLYEERIEAQNKKLKEIAFITSHTLRSPLANILGLVNVLDRNNPLSEVNKQVIDNIKISAEELDVVIRNIVDRTVKLEVEEN